MSFAAASAAAGIHSTSAELGELARLALAEGEEASALPLLAAAAEARDEARLWQWTALLQRSLDEHGAALHSFEQAAQLAPADAGIAHGRARVALEAGDDAVALFEQAQRLAPANPDVLLGLAAAKMAQSRGDEAERDLDAVLVQAPQWREGHLQLAQLRAMLGKGERAAASLERALGHRPGDPVLQAALLDLHLRREDYAALDAAAAAVSGLPGRRFYEAIAAAELGDIERADRLFADGAADPRLALWHIRHLLRSGRVHQALPLIDRELDSERAAAAWPYAATAWRLVSDPRWRWLEGDSRLVSVIDLAAALPPLDDLAALLRSLHVAKGEYLDQSVRGGTQTDGPLLSRTGPEIRALRGAITEAIERHVAQLPPPDPAHPTLGPRRDRPVRFSGSWSVRLRGAGHHSNHVHPQGWISSALYVALPGPQDGDGPNAGWLTLGEPQAGLVPSLEPLRLIEPRAGHLVLFPSWMWHGTRPFAQGERLTVAFDVAPPR